MNVGRGHWIFAALFLVLFIAIMVWSYRKDKPLTNTYYKGGGYIVFATVIAVLLFVYAYVKIKTSK